MGKCIRCGKEDFSLCEDGSCRIRRGQVEGVRVSDEPDIVVDERYADVPVKPEVRVKKRFSQTAVGRTLLLKNKTGKYGLRILLAGVAALTGVNLLPFAEPLIGGFGMIDLIVDFGLIELGITALAFLLTALASWFAAKNKIPQWLVDRFEAGVDWMADELVKATDEKSEAGARITKNEIAGILRRGFKRLLTKPEQS